jgi:hypothetical protein
MQSLTSLPSTRSKSISFFCLLLIDDDPHITFQQSNTHERVPYVCVRIHRCVFI